MLRRSVPDERPGRPFTGFKLAHAAVSVDGQRAGFAGLSIGARRVYGVSAEASCVWNRRHTPPKRRCGCGFYCLSTLAEARALSCATDNRAAVLLEVAAAGRFIRYERGLRYSRQRVQAVLVGLCRCGRPAQRLADAGFGVVGWRCLAAACPACAAGRASLAFGEFAACLGERVFVGADAHARLPAGAYPGGYPGAGAGGPLPGVVDPDDPPPPSSMAILTAEIALVQARLDDLQARIARYDGGYGTGSGAR